MNNEPPPNKPLDKRGVNKATMDAPQEEFVDDQSASTKRSSQTDDPADTIPQPKESGES